MKKKHIILILAFLVVAHGFGTYAALDRYLSSNAEVESVIEMPNASVNADGTDSAAKSAGKTFSSNEPNGKWNVDLMNMAVMSGEGVVDMASLDSGNSQRDLLAVDTYLQATFSTESFTPLPIECKEGSALPITYPVRQK